MYLVGMSLNLSRPHSPFPPFPLPSHPPLIAVSLAHLAMRAICLQTNCPRWKSITQFAVVGSCLRVLYSSKIVYLRHFYGLAAVDSNLLASPQRSPQQKQKQSCFPL